MKNVHVTVIGRLAAPPDVRETKAGTPAANFVLLVKEGGPSMKDGPDARERYHCSAYGKLAEAVGAAEVDARLIVLGELSTRRNGERSLRTLVAYDIGVSVMSEVAAG